jgi:glutaredoxin
MKTFSLAVFAKLRLPAALLNVIAALLLTGCSATKTLRTPTPDVVAFVAPWCAHCRSLERYLDDNRVPFQKLDIANDPRAKRMLESLGRDSVPTIIVNKTTVRGFDRKRLDALLFQ